MNKIRKNTGARVVGVDAGNSLFPKKGHYPPDTDEFINATAVAEIYTLLELDAVAVGLNDLSGGLDFLQETGNLGLSWVSANLYDIHGRPVFPPYVSKSFDDLSVAIVGITGPSQSDSDEFIIKGAAEVLADLLPGLSKVSDLIILLSAMPLADTVALIEQSSDVDVAIAADNAKNNISPFFSDTTLITQTGNRGRYQGVLSLNWRDSPLGISLDSELTKMRNRFKSINLQLDRLHSNTWDAASKAQEIRRLKEQQNELTEQIEELERELESGDNRNIFSTYEHRFLPLTSTGRTDPHIDDIIRDAKQRIAANRAR